MKAFKLIILMVSVCFIFANCGGGGSGSSTTDGVTDTGGAGSTGGSRTSLTIAEKVSVVDAQDSTANTSTSAFLRKLNLLNASVSDLPADSDYNTDISHVFVEERSADAFNIVNEILCMMEQTKYDAMIGEGDYKAQIDITLCEKNNDSASSAGQDSQNQSSGSNMPKYEWWTVNSYRADDNSPHIVSVWVHQDGDEFEPAMVIEAKVTITEAASDTNPYGLFHMNFKAHPKENNENLMHGYLRTIEDDNSNIILQFYNVGDFGSSFGESITFTEKVTISRSPDGTSGSGTIFTQESNPFENFTESFNIAFNENYFLREDGSKDNVCLSRTQFETTTHRYNLYYDENSSTPGNRVERNSGFPIRYQNGSENFFGWIGYWGIWLPGETNITSGDTVYKQDFGPEGSSDTPYNVFIVNGKLVKHTKKSVSLEEINGVPVSWHRCDGQTCSQFRVEWDSTDQALYKTAQMDESNWVWQEIDPVEVVFNQQDWGFNFWSESLGGSGHVNLFDPQTGQQISLSNDTLVTFHKENVVYPGDAGHPDNLYCFNECPDPDLFGGQQEPFIDQSLWSAGENSYEALAQQVSYNFLVAGTHYAAYTFDADSMVLQYEGLDVTMSANSDNNQWGIWTGALIDPADLDQLACDWDVNSTCPWQAHEKLDVFYTWETGANDWNKLSLLQDPNTGSFLEFDPPLMVEYTHTNGTKYFLDYSGNGELHGIPGKCIDMDTGVDIDCAEAVESKHIRWISQFSIPDGSAVTDATTNKTYYVKGLDKEQRMISVDDSSCSATGLTLQVYELPTGDLWEEPDIGEEPIVETAPAVIGGILQTQ